MAGVIDGILQDKESIKRQLGDRPEITTAPKRFVDRYRIKHYTAKVVSKSVAGSMIWGSGEYGIWGQDEWGSKSGSSFILNSGEFGVLGQNKLGAGGTEEALWAVLPVNNLHVEFFSQDMFIDTSVSSGTINTSNEEYSLQEGDVLQSNVVAKFREPIIRAKFQTHDELNDDEVETMLLGSLSLGTSTFTDDNANIYLSNDSGATWHSVLEGQTFTFPSNSNDDELKYKIVANSAVTLTKPLKIEVQH